MHGIAILSRVPEDAGSYNGMARAPFRCIIGARQAVPLLLRRARERLKAGGRTAGVSS